MGKVKDGPGRPSKGERVAFVVRLPEDTWRRLKYFTFDRRSSMADEIAIAVERYLKEERAKEQGQGAARP